MAASSENFSPSSEYLRRLREQLSHWRVDGVIIPRCDAHQGEYVPERAERLCRLTGFGGSAGCAVVMASSIAAKAALFVDGRYVEQAGREVDLDDYDVHNSMHLTPFQWLAERLRSGHRFGYDPWLHTVDDRDRFVSCCGDCDAEAVALAVNPVDAISDMEELPPWPEFPVRVHDEIYAGCSALAKRAEVAEALCSAGADAALLTLPDSIAWLLNIRGDDLAHTPVVLCFAMIDSSGGVELFVDSGRCGAAVRDHLGDVVLRSPSDLGEALDIRGKRGEVIAVDPRSAAVWFHDRLVLSGARILALRDPCLVLKAIKNAVERDGSRSAHRRDGIALVRFLSWLSREAPGGGVDELMASRRLADFRSCDALFRGLSFETISASGSHGSIIHYRVTGSSNRLLGAGDLYLVDSGGQYSDGTTDVTRTVVVTEATLEQRRNFTEVLRGHIALASIRFPRGVAGCHLDTLARGPLWRRGLDYDHGTGHGVGSYLSVHEGPWSISRNSVEPLEAGLILSNEPGYYCSGEYGIRIESLVLVREGELNVVTGREMLYFETLTLAPIDRKLIEVELLSSEEIRWLDSYHSRIVEELGGDLDEADREWLEWSCRPLVEGV